MDFYEENGEKMIEINGWVTIGVTDDGEDTRDQLSKVIDPMLGFNQILELKNLNGINTLFIGINHNHDNGCFESVKNLLIEIGKLAFGSYGLLHYRFPEDKLNCNKFGVLKLAKGKVTTEEDKLLSPCNPIIES